MGNTVSYWNDNKKSDNKIINELVIDKELTDNKELIVENNALEVKNNEVIVKDNEVIVEDNEVKVEDDKLLILKESDVLAIVEG